MNCPICDTQMIKTSIWYYCPQCGTTNEPNGEDYDDLSVTKASRRICRKKPEIKTVTACIKSKGLIALPLGWRY